MAKTVYPTFDLCNLKGNRSLSSLLNVDIFDSYLEQNPHLQTVHNHTFYHLAFFTKGSGRHIIDFEEYEIGRGMIYFMRPNQVHHWNFDSDIKGYIVNFSPTYFDTLLINSSILTQFKFLEGSLQNQVFTLGENEIFEVENLLNIILREQESKESSAHLLIATYLLQLFIKISRKNDSTPLQQVAVGAHQTIFNEFIKLVEVNYKQLKLPKAYASLLFTTPNQLNLICKELVGNTAGKIIRDRMILESKRLLINFQLNISDIAAALNFSDTSNFIKFFRKYVGITPEIFRNNFL